MKKIALIILGLTLVLVSNAQLRWGVKAGGNYSKFSTKFNANKLDNDKYQLGFHIGGIMEYSLSDDFAIQPELLFSLNGSKHEMGSSSADHIEKNRTTIYQLQLPIYLKMKETINNFKIIVLAGPYLGYALSGKKKYTEVKFGGENIIDEFDNVSNIYAKNGEFKRFDFGLGFGAGFEYKKFIISAGYQVGLANISTLGSTKIKLGTLQLSTGFFFN